MHRSIQPVPEERPKHLFPRRERKWVRKWDGLGKGTIVGPSAPLIRSPGLYPWNWGSLFHHISSAITGTIHHDSTPICEMGVFLVIIETEKNCWSGTEMVEWPRSIVEFGGHESPATTSQPTSPLFPNPQFPRRKRKTAVLSLLACPPPPKRRNKLRKGKASFGNPTPSRSRFTVQKYHTSQSLCLPSSSSSLPSSFSGVSRRSIETGRFSIQKKGRDCGLPLPIGPLPCSPRR